eukprot:Skav223693  [mRNA]  locus=scaffold1907:149356:151961:+ [translate_table: standard]
MNSATGPCTFHHRFILRLWISLDRVRKGLEDCIGYSIVHPTWQRSRPNDPADLHHGWMFCKPGDEPLSNSLGFGSFECDDALIPDTAGDTGGKYSTPLLWDKEKNTIVNNESMDILRMFNSKFNKWAKNPDLDLFPSDLEAEAEAANSWIYPNINNGVYRQPMEGTSDLGEALAKAEALLSKQRYVCGTRFSYMDLRLFMTLIRFDAVYVVYFKTNVGTIEMNYPNLLEFCKDIYQAINMRHIKMHYFTSHPDLNKFAVIPRGRDVDYSGPHKRAELSA